MGDASWRQPSSGQSAAGRFVRRVASTVLGDGDEASDALWRGSNTERGYGFATNNAVGGAHGAMSEVLLNGQHMADSPAARALAQRHTLSYSRAVPGGGRGFLERTHTTNLGHRLGRFNEVANRVLAPISVVQGVGQFVDGANAVRHGDNEGLVDMIGGHLGAASGALGIADMAGVAGTSGAAGLATSVAAAPGLAVAGAIAGGGSAGIALGQRGNRYAQESGMLGFHEQRAAGRGVGAGLETARGRDWSDWAADNGVAADRAVARATGSEALGTLAGLYTTGVSSVGASAGAAVTGAAGFATDAAGILGGGVRAVASGAGSIWDRVRGR